MADGRVVGCRFLTDDGAETPVHARATLLATGGAGQVFAETTNPPVATGDGVAMALRAGAALLDMEFVQFHPTALAVPGAPRFLVSEAVRGEGAILLNGAGERFTDELAPRDQVARAIFRENRDGRGPVRLDLRHLDADRVRTRFPRIVATCARYGIDPTREPIPVTPAAHYVMGGVATDLHGPRDPARALRGGRGGGERRARREPAGQQLAARGARLRRARGRVDGRGHRVRRRRRPPLGAAGPAARGTARAPREAVRGATWENLGLERSGDGLAELVRALDGWAERRASRRRIVPRPRRATWWTSRAPWPAARSSGRRAVARTSVPISPTVTTERFLGHTLWDGSPARLVDVRQPLQVGV